MAAAAEPNGNWYRNQKDCRSVDGFKNVIGWTVEKERPFILEIYVKDLLDSRSIHSRILKQKYCNSTVERK